MEGKPVEVPVLLAAKPELGAIFVTDKDGNDLAYVVDREDSGISVADLMRKLTADDEYEAKVVSQERFIFLVLDVAFQPSKKALETQEKLIELMGAEHWRNRVNLLNDIGADEDQQQEAFSHIAFMSAITGCTPDWDKPMNWRGDVATFMSAIRKFRMGYPIMVYGEPGSGKNELMHTVTGWFGYEEIRMTMDENVDSDTLVSTTSLVQNEDGNVITQNTKSALMTAMERPCCVVVDEVNYVNPAMLGGLNGPLERGVQLEEQLGKIAGVVRKVNTPSGLTINRHPGFRIAFTLNMDLAGCKQLNDSFWNRCSKINVKPQQSVGKVLSSKFKLNAGDIKTCDKLWGAIKKHATNVGLESVTDVSIRDFERAVEMAIVCSIPLKEALISEVVDSIQDPAMAEGARQALLAM